MKDKLKERVTNFAKSLDKSHWLDRADMIERFIIEELKAVESEYTLTKQDFQSIKDFSVKEWDNDNTVFVSTVLGTLSWLRSKDMLHFIIRGPRGDKNDSKPEDSSS